MQKILLQIETYFFNLFVKNKINKNKPAENHKGELSFKKEYKIINNVDNIKIFKIWFSFFPINIQIKVSPNDRNRFKLKLRLVKFKPCNVAIIFQIQIIVVKKIDDTIKIIDKDLNFICFLSN